MKSQGCSGMLPLAPNRPVNHFPCLFHLRSPPVKFGVHLVRDVSPGLSSNLNSQSDEGGVKSSCEQAGNKVKPSERGGGQSCCSAAIAAGLGAPSRPKDPAKHLALYMPKPLPENASTLWLLVKQSRLPQSLVFV